jgi:queuosine precursor transporter
MITRPKGYRFFHCIAMLFCACLLVSNTIAVKVVDIGGFVLPAGIILFPLAYLLNDCIVEVYGFEKTRSVIWWGFGCLAMMSLAYFLAIHLPSAVFYKDQEAFARLFGLAPRIAIASFTGYLVGSFLNAIVMSRMKIWTKGRFLWTRTIGSTVVGEGADSIIFNVIAFAGIFEARNLAYIAFSGFLLKTAYEIVATPLTYAIVGWLKRVEAEDKFDTGVSYSPFGA